MQVRIVTLRYSEGLQGFEEEPLKAAVGGHDVLDVREHFFLHGAIPHLALVVTLGDAPEASPRTVKPEDNPELQIAEGLRPLYRDLRRWRNEEARRAGIPSYTIMRNVQLAAICQRLPRTLAALKEIEGIGEATCTKYGAAILALLPAAAPAGSLEHAASQGGESR
jgi:superfamily II DNA helicase RecQ